MQSLKDEKIIDLICSIPLSDWKHVNNSFILNIKEHNLVFCLNNLSRCVPHVTINKTEFTCLKSKRIKNLLSLLLEQSKFQKTNKEEQIKDNIISALTETLKPKS